ncbi:MAG: 2-C-methyl-D-erythritol 4-phosphate cytidylyltransferase [Thermoanaerobaculia bacterium]
MKILVIIPAGGSGTRFGGQIPKQFQLLAGKPLLQHVIERFLADQDVVKIIVPVIEAALPGVDRSPVARVQFVAGGTSRLQSVTRGFEAATEDYDVVAVHDAVRPFFRFATFHAVVEAAQEFGAAFPAIPITDTIHVMNEDGTIRQTLDRNTLAAAQTPQCFRADVLRDVLQRAAAAGDDGTDEAGLAARYGHIVKAVAGDPTNVKITRPDDLSMAETHFEEWRAE